MPPHTVVKRRKVEVRKCTWTDGTKHWHITYCRRPNELVVLRIDAEDTDDLIAALRELRAQKEDA